MMKPLRLGIMGSAGSGKTKLAQVLCNALEISPVDEGVREWLAHRNLKEPKNLSWDVQLQLQDHYVAAKMRSESSHQAFVSDRTTLDAVVNLQLRGVYRGESAKIPSTLVDRALAYARQTYDRIVLLRWNGTPKPAPDGVRETDSDLLQNEYDLCWSLCNSIGLSTTIVSALPEKQEIDCLVNEFRYLSLEHEGAFSGRSRTCH